MKRFADENVAYAIIRWLREAGHDVLSAAESTPGEGDAIWLRRAEQEERIVITSDKDFGELIFRDRLNSHGIVLIRMQRLSLQARLLRLTTVWTSVEANPSDEVLLVKGTISRS